MPVARASLPSPAGDQAAGGLIDDEPEARGGEQVPVRGGAMRSPGAGAWLPWSRSYSRTVSATSCARDAAGAVPGGADLPVPARVVVALADGEVGEGGAVGRRNWWGIPQLHIALTRPPAALPPPPAARRPVLRSLRGGKP